MFTDRLSGFLLVLFATNTLGVVLYCGLFSYSFNRRKNFILRLCLSLFVIAGITLGASFGIYYGFTHGIETTLKKVELLRMGVNVLALLMGIGMLFVCFDENPTLLLFAIVMGYAGNSLGSNIYEIIIELTHSVSIFFMWQNDYDVLGFLMFFAVHAVVFFSLYFTCARAFAKTAKTVDRNINRSIVGMFVIATWTLTAIQGSNVFNSAYSGAMLEAVSYTFHGLMAMIYIIIIFSLRFILVWVHTSQEKEAEKAFYDSYREKIELQERNMELINVKCHDMKHQLRTLLERQNLDEEFIKETQNAISIFDADVKTGNYTLDTLLTQKSLVCNAQKIQLTVMLDGDALSFMSVQDINSFFGNAIDNAIEYLATTDEENRFIRISSFQNGNILTIRIENYCDTALKFNKNGRPQTTKEDNGYHGFGTKSMQKTAQKYNGDASFVRQDDLFIVTALFMI